MELTIGTLALVTTLTKCAYFGQVEENTESGVWLDGAAPQHGFNWDGDVHRLFVAWRAVEAVIDLGEPVGDDGTKARKAAEFWIADRDATANVGSVYEEAKIKLNNGIEVEGKVVGYQSGGIVLDQAGTTQRFRIMGMEREGIRNIRCLIPWSNIQTVAWQHEVYPESVVAAAD